jgi:hypothetical protein
MFKMKLQRCMRSITLAIAPHHLYSDFIVYYFTIWDVKCLTHTYRWSRVHPNITSAAAARVKGRLMQSSRENVA